MRKILGLLIVMVFALSVGGCYSNYDDGHDGHDGGSHSH